MRSVGMQVSDLETRWDAIIVGGGAVGICSAITLSRGGMKVLLLEAGPVEPPADFVKRNAGPNTGKSHSAVLDGRMKALGGTTRLWGGQLVRFSREDFERDSQCGASLWPFGFAEVSHYYDEVLKLLQVPQKLWSPESLWRQLSGRDTNVHEGLSIGLNLWMRQPDFTKVFKEELMGSERLHVRTECTVRDLVRYSDAVEGKDSRYQLRVSHPSRPGFDLISSDHIILAAGTLENVAILKRSNSLDTHDPVFQNRNIGGYFIDHLHRIVGTLKVADRGAASKMFDNFYADGYKVGVKVRRDLGHSDGDKVNIAAQFLSPVPIRLLMRETLRLFSRCLSADAGGLSAIKIFLSNARILFAFALRFLLQQRALNFYTDSIDVGIEIEQVPSEMSRVIISDDGRPGVHWHIGGSEISAVQEFVRDLQRMVQHHGIGTFTPRDDLDAHPEFFFDECRDANHHMGGTRFGFDSSEGVVDADSKLFGSDNIYIAGASTFPSGSFANPTLTAIALALRLCQSIGAGAR